jgi:hypothetical protein
MRNFWLGFKQAFTGWSCLFEPELLGILCGLLIISLVIVFGGVWLSSFFG